MTTQIKTKKQKIEQLLKEFNNFVLDSYEDGMSEDLTEIQFIEQSMTAFLDSIESDIKEK